MFGGKQVVVCGYGEVNHSFINFFFLPLDGMTLTSPADLFSALSCAL